MPRRNQEFQPGGYYHIYNRGASGGVVFFGDADYIACLRRIKVYAGQYQVAVIAYCLMPTHYHFLLRQEGDTPISKFIGVLFNAYAQSVNLRHQRSGALFESRFKHRPVLEEAYLVQLCRYIHANPVKDGLVTDLNDWLYSNYPEWLGMRSGVLVDRDFVQTYFPTPAAYRAFVAEYLVERRLPPGLDYLE